MGQAQLVLTATLTRAQWDTLLTAINNLIAQNPALNLKIDKAQSAYTEAPS
jgi:hypothetical protein